MDNKLTNRLLLIAAFALAIAGLGFIGLSIYYGVGSNYYLICGLACCALGNLFTAIMAHSKKK